MLHLPRLHNLVCSTMPRAIETARIIVNELANAGWPVAASADDDVKSAKAIVLKTDELLEEGNPIPPSPPLAHVRADHYYWRDGTSADEPERAQADEGAGCRACSWPDLAQASADERMRMRARWIQGLA